MRYSSYFPVLFPIWTTLFVPLTVPGLEIEILYQDCLCLISIDLGCLCTYFLTCTKHYWYSCFDRRIWLLQTLYVHGRLLTPYFFLVLMKFELVLTCLGLGHAPRIIGKPFDRPTLVGHLTCQILLVWCCRLPPFQS